MQRIVQETRKPAPGVIFQGGRRAPQANVSGFISDTPPKQLAESAPEAEEGPDADVAIEAILKHAITKIKGWAGATASDPLAIEGNVEVEGQNYHVSIRPLPASVATPVGESQPAAPSSVAPAAAAQAASGTATEVPAASLTVAELAAAKSLGISPVGESDASTSISTPDTASGDSSAPGTAGTDPANEGV